MPLPPPDSANKQEFTQSYSGVEIKFTAGEFTSGKTVVVAQATNNQKGVTASLTPRDGSGAAKTSVKIQPGERVTLKLDSSDGFEVDLQFSATDPSSINQEGVIETTLKSLKHWIRTKDG